MADTIYTKDGKCHVIFSKSDVIDLINDYIGDEVSRYIENKWNEVDKELQEQRDDNERWVWIFDDFAQELKDELECIQELIDRGKKKSEIKKAVDRAYGKVLEQI